MIFGIIAAILSVIILIGCIIKSAMTKKAINDGFDAAFERHQEAWKNYKQ